MHMIFYVEMQEVVESNGVVCRNDQVTVTYFLRDHEGRSCLRPILPHEFLGVVKHVEDVYFFRHFYAKDDRSNFVIRVQFQGRNEIRVAIVKMHVEFAEFLSRSLLNSSSNRPNTAKHTQVCQYFFNFFGNFCFLLIIGFNVSAKNLEIGAHESHFRLMDYKFTESSGPSKHSID